MEEVNPQESNEKFMGNIERVQNGTFRRDRKRRRQWTDCGMGTMVEES